MIEYLEERAPCVYLPNNDGNYACVSPKLSHRVAVIGHIHSDDPDHYEIFATLGKYWNATVGVSQAIARKAATLCPELAARIAEIPYGVKIPRQMPSRAWEQGKEVRIVYCGRLVHEQKRVLDLPRIVAALEQRGVPVHLTIIGGGTDEQRLKEACAPLVQRGSVSFLGVIPNEEILKLLLNHDVIVLTSSFEGTPVVLLEAMGQGCVPVVTAVDSGVPELIQDGVNGYALPIGDIKAFAERLADLQKNADLRRSLAQCAFATVDRGQYRIEDMTRRHLELFERVWQDVETGAYRRPSGPITLPPFMRVPLKYRLPAPLRTIGVFLKRALGRVVPAAKGVSGNGR